MDLRQLLAVFSLPANLRHNQRRLSPLSDRTRANMETTLQERFSRARKATIATIEGALYAPLDLVPYYTSNRVRGLAIFALIIELVYVITFHFFMRVPYESTLYRLLAAGHLLVALWSPLWRRLGQYAFNIFWQWLWFFILTAGSVWLYVANGYNDIRLAGCTIGIFMLFRIVDWRLATLQILFAILFNWALYGAGVLSVPPDVAPAVPNAHLTVVLYSWIIAAILAASSANVRKERMEASRVTLGIVAHEFRTPLGAATVLNETIRKLADKESPGAARKIADLSDRMSSIFKSMNSQIDLQMNNARIAQGISAIREVVDVDQVIRDSVKLYPESYPGQSENITLELASDTRVVGNRELLLHVFFNLYSNAFKAIDKRSRPIQRGDIKVLSFPMERDGVAGALIQVADRGIGIPSHEVSRLFTPFHSTETAPNSPTHGLGLAMCQRTITRFRGTIDVESNPGDGTTFTIWLPMSTSDEDGIPAENWEFH